MSRQYSNHPFDRRPVVWAAGLLALTGFTACGSSSSDDDEDVVVPPIVEPEPELMLISRSDDGSPANAPSAGVAVSGDGRYVLFRTEATNITDPLGVNIRLIRYDREDGSLLRMDTDASGDPANGSSGTFGFDLSENGEVAVFSSVATDLVADDTNGFRDIFRKEATTGAIARVSVDSTGTEADDLSLHPAVTADGSQVVFGTKATNLVAGDANGARDIIRRDIGSGTTSLISITSAGSQIDGDSGVPDTNADGTRIAFETLGSNLGFGFVGIRLIAVHDIGSATVPASTTVITTDALGNLADGSSEDPSIDGEGRFVAFTSDATNLVADDTNASADVFVKNVETNDIFLVSRHTDGAFANDSSYAPAISGNGRYVVFASDASNLVDDDTNGTRDVFRHDGSTGETIRVSQVLDGTEGDGVAGTRVAISDDGSVIAFSSTSTNLVADDTNGLEDIFVAVIPPDTVQ